jgi:hypothetical protein
MVVAAKVCIRDWSFSVYLHIYVLSGLSFHVTGYHNWHVIPHFYGVPRCNNLEKNWHGLFYQTATSVDIGTGGWTLLETTDHSLHSTRLTVAVVCSQSTLFFDSNIYYLSLCVLLACPSHPH